MSQEGKSVRLDEDVLRLDVSPPTRGTPPKGPLKSLYSQKNRHFCLCPVGHTKGSWWWSLVVGPLLDGVRNDGSLLGVGSTSTEESVYPRPSSTDRPEVKRRVRPRRPFDVRAIDPNEEGT